MRLKRIHLTNFRRFADFEAQFGPGINVVKGPRNEMGKSTLLEGIIVALFQNPKSAAREVKAYASWGSTGQFRTSLEFEHEGKGYLLDKDFDKGTVKLTCTESGEEIDTFKEVAEKMDELLGTRSDRLFVCSCCIRQSQVAEVSDGRKEIGDSLEEVVTGGKESTLASQVIQKLESKVADMKRGLDKPAKNPGIIAALKNRLQEASLRLNQVSSEVLKVEAQKVELVDVTGQLAQVKDEHEKCRALLEKNSRRRDVEEKIEGLRKEYERVEELLGRVRKHEENLKKAGEELEAIDGFEDRQQVLELRRKLDDIRRKREDIGKDLAERQAELAAAGERRSRAGLAGFLGSEKGIAAAVAILAGGIVGALLGPVYLVGLAAVGAVLLVVSTRARISLVREKAGISGVKERIQRMKESLEQLGAEEQEPLMRAGCSTVDGFDQKEKSFRHWVDKKGEAKYRLEETLAGRTPEEVE
ncbi:MAG: AAA family ATPase, partial [Dehalococcoidia bacterium]